MNKYFFKNSALLLSTVIVSAGILPNISQAEEVTTNKNKINIFTKHENNNLVDKNTKKMNVFNINDNNFKLPTIQEMTPEQLEHFNNIVDEQVLLNGKDNPEEFRRSVVAFFDSTSVLYMQNEMATSALGLWIANDVFGAAINTAIGMAVGGGVGIAAIQAYIKKVGKEAAKKMFYKTIKDKLLAIGAGSLAASIEGAINFAFNYLDFGNALAKYLDSKDYKPNNGRINF
ncbi:hypothetical protein IKE_06301 [Bacillus cereus VD196]|uniref:Uncharacterized protein n=1 Tax=Bacillus cereus VD196 TaxID=1053243 RepID=A0A9W5PXM3_BACCE|nr:hypothetical protein [Bacillus cereus]EOO57789.1 hypothetical protein IKE_06301 [Bacillus cereus VD196]